MTLKAIIFGSIGTLTETSELQRAAFNAAFAEVGLDWDWDADSYRNLVAGGASGGEQRIAAYAEARDETLTDGQAAQIHARKSALFQQAMAAGVAPNPGVVALIEAARAAGLKIGFASTTSAANIDAMFAATAPALTRAHFDAVMDADGVANGKPAPDVYLEVARRLGVAASEALAIEDTLQSAASPRAAGMATLIVPGMIARGQDFAEFATVETLEGFTLDDAVELLETRVADAA
ncbi:HAD-IA family hydrolase [Glacieibacterium frigidum]|uniref:HAD-IA family hydrolase n=1 Tax=Glacieibacterium frigidum TaxID=2593303 RepID=A0A552U8U2_9SPHN|nr:HAD-IA family hydrolase [Glacieibacterium frigidum]TRW14644.1 HAD-IA family hydrolase [Glacieibacterium frigidum]